MKKPELSGLKRFLEKRGIGREQLLCIAVTGLMLLLYILFGRGDSGLEEGFLLERGSYGEGDREYELFVNGLSEETERISIVLSEREYKKEEFDSPFNYKIIQLSECFSSILLFCYKLL